MKLGFFIRETVEDAIGILTSKEALRNLLNESLYRNAIQLTLSRGTTAVIGFAFWLLAARFYSATDVGQASALISTAGWLSLLATLGLDYGLIRFLNSSDTKPGAVINSTFTICGLLSVVFAVVFIAGLRFWSPALIFLQEDLLLSIGFVIFTACYTFFYLAIATFIACRRTGFGLVQSVTEGVTRVGLVVPLGIVLHSSGIFSSWFLSFVIAASIGVLLFIPRIQSGYRFIPTIDRQVIRRMASFSLANYAAVLLWATPITLMPLLVANRLETKSTAYLYIAFGIAAVLYSAATSMSQSLFAESTHNEQKLGVDIKRSLKAVSVILLPAVVIVFLLGDKILLLFGSDYSENAAWLLRIMAIAVFPLSINHLYFAVKRVEKQVRNIMWIAAFVAVSTLTLAWFLMPYMGIQAAGVAWIVSQTVVALFILGSLLKSMTHVRSPLRNSHG